MKIKVLVHPSIQIGFEQLAVDDGFAITNVGKSWIDYTLESVDESSLAEFIVDAAALYKDALRLRSVERDLED